MQETRDDEGEGELLALLSRSLYSCASFSPAHRAAPRRTLTLSPRGVVRARYRAPAGAITTPLGKM